MTEGIYSLDFCVNFYLIIFLAQAIGNIDYAPEDGESGRMVGCYITRSNVILSLIELILRDQLDSINPISCVRT
jgi:hypothetical protein